jgi:hypothetical protein
LAALTELANYPEHLLKQPPDRPATADGAAEEVGDIVGMIVFVLVEFHRRPFTLPARNVLTH